MRRALAFQDLPIRDKLRIVILFISGLAMVGACTVFLVQDWLSSRRSLARQLAVMAEIVADQSTPAVEFNQREQAALILRSLKAERQLVAAAIFGRGGTLFASYVRDGSPSSVIPEHPGPAGPRFDGSELDYFRPMTSGRESIGTFYLRSDMADARRRLMVDLGTVGLVLLGATGAILYLSGRLGRVVTDPLLRLAGVVSAVSKDRNYSIRVENRSRDEVGRLIDGFNDMLSQIEVRDAALARSQHELEQRVQDRTRDLESFSYSVSHDLRAPLRHIGGYAELLDKHSGTQLDDVGRRYLDKIGHASRRMGILIDELLRFSRMARVELSASRVSLGDMVHEIIAEMEQDTAGRAIDWRIGTLPEVEADPSMLRQVFANLIGNAVKYTGTRAQAEIEIGSIEGDGSEVVVFVRDNGVGFDMQYADKLFGVFQRLHGADEFEGTGIGLANVRRIIERHGGKTWADGRVDRGAIFYFSLPLTAAMKAHAS